MQEFDTGQFASRPIIRRPVSWYAVRCCCKPTTIFGFLPLSLENTGSQTIRDYWGISHKIDVKPISRMCRVGAMIEYVMSGDSEPPSETSFDSELAVYSDDRPIEFWRTIPGFVEAADQALPK